MNDFLWDSPIYREIITDAETKGMERGMAEGSRQALDRTLVEMVNKRFPELKPLALEAVSKIGEADALSYLIVEISMLQTAQDAKRVLEMKLKAGSDSRIESA